MRVLVSWWRRRSTLLVLVGKIQTVIFLIVTLNQVNKFQQFTRVLAQHPTNQTQPSNEQQQMMMLRNIRPLRRSPSEAEPVDKLTRLFRVIEDTRGVQESTRKRIYELIALSQRKIDFMETNYLRPALKELEGNMGILNEGESKSDFAIHWMIVYNSSNILIIRSANKYYYWEYGQTAGALVIFCMIVAGNLSILHRLKSHRRRRSNVNYFIVQLAIADLLVGVFSVTLDSWLRIQKAFTLGLFACRAFKFTQHLFIYSSTNLLVALSIDRWEAVVKPLAFTRNRSRGYHLVAGSWLLALICALPVTFYIKIKEIDGLPQCWIDLGARGWRVYLIYLTTILLILPTLIIAICYSHIVYTIWLKARQVSEQQLARCRHVVEGRELELIRNHQAIDELDADKRSSCLKSADRKSQEERKRRWTRSQTIEVGVTCGLTSTGADNRQVSFDTQVDTKLNEDELSTSLTSSSSSSVFSEPADDDDDDDEDAATSSTVSLSTVAAATWRKSSSQTVPSKRKHLDTNNLPSIDSTKIDDDDNDDADKQTEKQLVHEKGQVLTASGRARTQSEDLGRRRNGRRGLAVVRDAARPLDQPDDATSRHDSNTQIGGRRHQQKQKQQQQQRDGPVISCDKAVVAIRETGSPSRAAPISGRDRDFRASTTTTSAKANPSTNSSSSSSSQQHGSGVIPKARIKTIKMTLVIVVAYILCWSPFLIVNLCSVFGLLKNDTNVSHALMTLTQSLAHLNSAVNPIIFWLFSSKRNNQQAGSSAGGGTTTKAPPINTNHHNGRGGLGGAHGGTLTSNNTSKSVLDTNVDKSTQEVGGGAAAPELMASGEDILRVADDESWWRRHIKGEHSLAYFSNRWHSWTSRGG